MPRLLFKFTADKEKLITEKNPSVMGLLEKDSAIQVQSKITMWVWNRTSRRTDMAINSLPPLKNSVLLCIFLLT